MGTHPIFESDFDCLTDFVKNGFRGDNERRNRPQTQKSGKRIKSGREKQKIFQAGGFAPRRKGKIRGKNGNEASSRARRPHRGAREENAGDVGQTWARPGENDAARGGNEKAARTRRTNQTVWRKRL